MPNDCIVVPFGHPRPYLTSFCMTPGKVIPIREAQNTAVFRKKIYASIAERGAETPESEKTDLDKKVDAYMHKRAQQETEKSTTRK